MRCDVNAFDVTVAARAQPVQQFCFVGGAEGVKLWRRVEHCLILSICCAIVSLPREDSTNRCSGIECFAGATDEIDVIHLCLGRPEILAGLGAEIVYAGKHSGPGLFDYLTITSQRSVAIIGVVGVLSEQIEGFIDPSVARIVSAQRKSFFCRGSGPGIISSFTISVSCLLQSVCDFVRVAATPRQSESGICDSR